MNLDAMNAYTGTLSTSNSTKRNSFEQPLKQVDNTTEQVVIGKDKPAEEISFSEKAAVYEPSKEGLELQDAHAVEKSDITKTETDRTALIQQLQADAEAQKNSLIDMVREALGKQSSTYSLSIGDENGVWKFLASGDYTVTEAAKKEAQEAISEGGYWSVEQTAQRIFDFAQNLSGGNVEKADMLLSAFEKGFDQATKIWGDELPEISQQTYDAVEKKFEEWKNSVAE